MPDVPGNSSTTSTIIVGGSVTNTLEIAGDHDWFRMELVAGQKLTISLNGITLSDAYLRIYNSSSGLLAENDDISPGVVLDSRLVFTAPYSGTFYIDAGAFEDSSAGTYQLNVEVYTPPPVATYSVIADHLTSGYWGGEVHKFNVAPGGTITYDFHSSGDANGVTAAGQTLAREALALWSDVMGITFLQVASGGQITFADNEEGAFSDGNWSNGIISNTHVNVSTQWLADYGTGLNGYAFQTYIHEIGHALGLGHGGFYNSTASYADDALFANDGWPSTIMSYFDQDESVYFNDLGFSRAYVVTPMLADIRAIGTLYGLSTTTRTGDTTYGFGNNSGRSVYTAAVGNTLTAQTIYDSGGIDTLNYSGFTSNQNIDLSSEMFSDIGGGIGNVSIAFGTVIENAVGGSGHDQIHGNSTNNVLTGNAGNDVLNGFDGNDTLIGGLGNDSLTGGNGADTVSYASANAGVTVNLVNQNAQSTGGGDVAGIGIDSLASVENIVGSNFSDALTGDVMANQIEGGGGNDSIVGGGGDDLLIGGAGSDTLTGGAGNDIFRDTTAGFNGDNIADFAVGERIVFTDATLAGFTFNLSSNTLSYTGGALILGGGVSGQLVASAASGGGVQLMIQASVIADVRNDFNGDGRSDILWRNVDGTLSNWLGQANGGFTPNNANAAAVVPTAWFVAGTGDFNGDGRDDILWRNVDGQMSNWLGTANGGFTPNNANAAAVVPTDWHVVGTGDFNGDGRDDILWRNDNGTVSNWLGTAAGGFTPNDANAARFAPTDWHVVGTGDFNGDGRDDILWRNNDGTVSDWLGQANGGFILNDAAALTVVPTAWFVAGTGDFNGDGRDDILWRNNDGTLSNWLGQANGGFVANDANAAAFVPTSWTVVATGDYNGDGRDDILWRNSDGTVSNWLGQANGGFTPNDANAAAPVPTSWHVQPEPFLL